MAGRTSWRARVTALVAWLGILSACATRQAPVPTPSAVTGSGAAAPSRTAEAEKLPDGRGKEILQASCTSCHDLGEVTKFKGYYDRAQWRDIVVTMVEYGARLETNDVEVLSDYLVQHLGRR